jgi:HEAT repeat protein
MSEALAALLDEREVALRWAAARALSELADAAVIPQLSAHLHDVEKPEGEAQRVCDFLRAALERINASSAGGALRPAPRK